MQNSSNNLLSKLSSKENRTFLVVAVLVALLFLFFIFQAVTYRERAFEKARHLLREYKTAKALSLLTKLRNTNTHIDQDLNFMIFYSYIKSMNFSKAADELELIDEVPKEQSFIFGEIVQQLSIANQVALIIDLVKRAHKLGLESQFFIDLSQERDSIQQELELLQAGIAYLTVLDKNQPDSHFAAEFRKLDNYLVRRYVEIANIYRGSKEYYMALKYLEKAREKVKRDNKSPYKSEIYLNIGLVYKNMKKYSKAWENIKFAEKLGSETARDMINNLHQNYIPGTTN